MKTWNSSFYEESDDYKTDRKRSRMYLQAECLRESRVLILGIYIFKAKAHFQWLCQFQDS